MMSVVQKYFNLKIASLIFILAFGFSSCKIRQIVPEKPKTSTIDIIYDSLRIVETNYKTLELKINMDYESSKQQLSLKGSIKMLKDSLIWVSLSPGLGIEGARCLCTKDSVFVLDRINKTLTKSDYQFIKKNWKVDVDFNSLQSILAGEVFVYPNIPDEKADFVSTFKLLHDSAMLEVYRKSVTLVENLIKIDKSNYKINAYLINDIANKRSLNINYQQNRFNNETLFPKTIKIKSMNEGKYLNIDLNYTKLTINNDLSFSFNFPASYKIVVH